MRVPQPHRRQPASRLHPRAAGLFSDGNLDIYAHLLDDVFRIPGTRIRLGIDGLIGLVPGIGDALAGVASSVFILAAWLRGVPYVTIVRMMFNLVLAVLVGTVPLFGDIFDILWKTNRRNYALLTRHLREPHRHTWKDYVFLGVLAVAVAALWLAHRL